jgi:perosamine synthetase
VIPHNRPTLGEREAAAAARVIRSGWLAPGPEVAAFEDALCARLGLPPGHAVACSSGSAALFLALRSMGARKKRVAVPAYACLALRNAVAMAGGTVVLIDNPPGKPNIDAATIRAAGVDLAIPVSSFGIPTDDDTFDLVPAIDDACQALGASSRAGPTGTRGRAGVFSFYATKLLTTGGHGGAVVSRDHALIENVRDYLSFDAREDQMPRFNLQLTDLGAAVGLVQLSRLEAFVQRRAVIWDHYRTTGYAMIDAEYSEMRCVRYRSVIRGTNARSIIAQLQGAGISAIVPIEQRELLAPEQDCPNAFELARSTVSLPCFPSLTDTEIRLIVETLECSPA